MNELSAPLFVVTNLTRHFYNKAHLVRSADSEWTYCGLPVARSTSERPTNPICKKCILASGYREEKP